MKSCKVLAFDFGASTGRAILGTLSQNKLLWKEVHRFDNVPVWRGDTLYWDIDTLIAGIREGMEKAVSFDSVAFDTWGVDFGLLDSEGNLLDMPVHYRDRRTVGMVEEITKKISADSLYRLTGNRLMEINTLFQLMALKTHHPDMLEKAKTLLFMPDLFAYLISGMAVCEQSIASTSQMLNPVNRKWCMQMLDELGLPADILLPVIPSGSITGALPNGARMIAAAGHDTQCAVAAVPFRNEDAAFLSCGTWSLLGTELSEPILTAESANLGLSNELGANGKVNYLKNIVGLWLIQESRRQWKREGREYSFAGLETMALQAEPFLCFIDPDDPIFTPPGDMPERVREFCRQTGQCVPKSTGGVVRCIYESLAMKYCQVLEQISQVTGKKLRTLHIIGGGAQAKLLCQMAASGCAISVEAGPVEATALGNLVIQLIALGELPDIEAGRKLIAAGETIVRYEPRQTEKWEQAYERFKKVITRR